MNVDQFKQELVQMSPKSLQRLFFDFLSEDFERAPNNLFYVKENLNYCVRVSRLIKHKKFDTYLDGLLNSNELGGLYDCSHLNFQQIKSNTDFVDCIILTNEFVIKISLDMESILNDKMIQSIEYDHQGKKQYRFFINQNNLNYLSSTYGFVKFEYDEVLQYAKCRSL